MTTSTTHPVIRGHHRYGSVRRELDGTWTGEKVGEFGTVRHGYETREGAEAWVLTNRAYLVTAVVEQAVAS